MKISKKTFCFGLCLFFGIASVWAEADYSSNKTLSLDDVSQIALSNSPDIQILQYTAYIDSIGVEKSHSLFDIKLNGTAAYINNKKLLNLTDSGAYSTTNQYILGANKLFAYGTELGLNLDQSRIDSNLYPTHYDADTLVSLKQSLGKNFFGLQDRLSIDLSVLIADYSDLLAKEKIERQLALVQKSYWNLVYKGQLLKAFKKMHEHSVELYKVYQEKSSTGVAEEYELIAVEANMRKREKQVIAAVAEREIAKNNLLTLINEDDLAINLIVDDKLPFISEVVDHIKVLNLAIVNRRDYKQMLNLAEQNNIDIRLKKNSLWPTIDLTATYGANGMRTGSGKAWTDVRGKSDDAYYAGVTFTMSLNRTKERAELKVSEAMAEKIIAQTRSVELKVIKEINNICLRYNSLIKETEYDMDILSLQRSKLSLEEDRISYGRSNIDTLVRYQDDVLAAEVDYLNSLLSLNAAGIDLKLMQNMLLNKYLDSIFLINN